MLKMMNVNVTLDGDQGRKQILKDINLTFEDKKIYVITGPNGSGKTSIAKAIMGIFPTSSGAILLNDTDITHMGIAERAQMGIGYAFQQPPRFKGIKVRELLNLAAGPGVLIDPCQLLYDVGLCAQDYLDRDIDASFSGGELKRIEIATILARDLKVAIFDEPEAGIDLWSFQKLKETFEQMNEKRNTTIIIISHQERIMRLAHQVIIVEEGRVSEITSQEKIISEIERLESDCKCRKDCKRGGKANDGCNR